MDQADHEQHDVSRPLIVGSDGSQVDGISSSMAEIPVTFKNAGTIVRFLTMSAGISGLLFGFDTGVISSTLVSIGSDLSNRPLTTPDKSLVTAVTSLLALFSAPSTGFLADRFGRKTTIFVPALLFIIGAIIQAVAEYVWTMVLGRALVGVAIGIASGAVPLYITELAPAELRGRLVTIQALFITGGQVIAYLIGFLLATLPYGWRWMVGLGAVPAGVQIFLLFWMPETPRHLIAIGQDQRAKAVLLDIYDRLPDDAKAARVRRVIGSIQEEMSSEGDVAQTGATKALFTNVVNRRALTIACLLQALQQLCGFNSLMYFSATIFASVGFTSPIGTSLSIAFTNFVFTLVAFACIDRVGRRNILLRSLPLMILGLCACGLAFAFLPIRQRMKDAVAPAVAPDAWSIVLLVSMILYVAAYAVGIGCVPWQQSELFPLRVRSLGSGVATATNWSSNFVIGATFLPMMNVLGPTITFLLYAVVCSVGWILVWQIYPETAGLELEEVGEILQKGWGVRESVARFGAWRAVQDEHTERNAEVYSEEDEASDGND